MRHEVLFVAVAVTAVSLAHPRSVVAQPPQNPLHPEIAVARWFAPILWPATYESVWPTIPHALAFDGLDNDGNGLVDLEDPLEVSFASGDSKVDDVIADFSKLRDKPARRVLYARPKEFRTGSIDVLEYWFYYFYDRGPGSHVHDAEHAFLFLDVSSPSEDLGALNRYRWRIDPGTGLSDAVRVVVGAAHEESTANNVLATSRESHRHRIVPRQLPAHVPLLSELGKHASAPDLQLDGRFDAGMDANFFRGSLWGLRDSFAAGLGEVGFMTFESWQSFPRHPSAIVVEESYVSATDPAFRDTYRPYAVRLESPETYALFPLEDLERLYDLLDDPDPDVGLRVASFLREHQLCFWADAKWSGVITPAALNEMRRWPASRGHVKVWEHADHRQTEDIFKLHLFPRMAFGFGMTWDSGKYPAIYRLVMEVSDVKWADRGHWPVLGFLLPERLFPDSRLELNLLGTEGTVRGWALQHLGVTWKKGRGNRNGMYLGVQWRKAEVLPGERHRQEDLEQISFETGVPIENLRRRPGGRGWPLGIRAGTFVGHSFMPGGRNAGARFVRSLFPWGGRVEGQFGVVMERDVDHSDVERALGARPNVRFQYGVTFTWNPKFLRPKPWTF
jgi:hypothetical protein